MRLKTKLERRDEMVIEFKVEEYVLKEEIDGSW